MSKQTVAVLCGGQSVEHDISLMSAANVVRDFDHERFDIEVIYIARDGQWYRMPDQAEFIQLAADYQVNLEKAETLLLKPGTPKTPFIIQTSLQTFNIDCAFPVLHGMRGEDGTMQGLLEILNVPYVGCDTVSSALSMEKHLCKQVWREAGVPTLDWLTMHVSDQEHLSYQQLTPTLSDSFFMKTVNSGSSLGVYKVRNETEYKKALTEIFKFDDSIILERAVNARELEVSVIGDKFPQATPPGEVLVYDDFYTYDAKYFNPDGSATVTPAEVSESLANILQKTAIEAYKALRCNGMARVDFLVVSDTEFYLNEINPLPGFTNISMYPKNWQATGLSYTALLSRLVDIAFERHQSQLAHQVSIDRFVLSKKEQQSAI